MYVSSFEQNKTFDFNVCDECHLLILKRAQNRVRSQKRSLLIEAVKILSSDIETAVSYTMSIYLPTLFDQVEAT